MDISPQLLAIAPDLRLSPPRSPRETLAGYLLAARTLDKCRASLTGRIGDYFFHLPPGATISLDKVFFDFTGIDPEDFRRFVATAADDAAVAQWITSHAIPRPRIDIIKWNNWLRDFRLSDAPDAIQEQMEDYIARHLPKNRPIYRYLDIYDIEEGRL